MSDPSDYPSDSRRYIFTAVVAALFLLILPSIVIAIASDRTGIRLFQGDGPPPPEYIVLDWRRNPESLILWVRVPDTISDDEMFRVTQDVVRERYRGTPHIAVRFYLEPNFPQPVSGRSRTDMWDAVYRWRMREGVVKVFP